SGRQTFPPIPDFTAPSWPTTRSEAQLRTSILDGKGKDMPSFRGKVKEEQARELAAYVRTFATNANPQEPRKQQAPRSPSDCEAEFGRLEKKMDALQKQVRDLRKGSADKKRSTGSEPADGSRPRKEAESRGADATRPGSLTTGTSNSGMLYQQRCVK